MAIPSFDSQSTNFIQGYFCENCKQEYPIELFNETIYRHGFFHFAGRDINYIGTNCHNCHNTLLMEEQRTENPLANNLFTGYLEFQNGKAAIPEFRYYSPVEIHPYIKTKVELGEISRLDFIGNPANENFIENAQNEIYLRSDEDPILAEQFLLSFAHPGGEKAMGSYLSILWMRPETLKEAVKIENNLKERVLPRYQVHSLLLEAADHFSWHNYRILDHLKEVGIPFKITNPDHPRNSILRNVDFLRLIDDATQPGLSQSHIRTATSTLIIYPDENESDVQTDQGNNKDASKIIKENISKKVWEAFRNKSTQKLLYAMSMEFIFDYMKGAQNLDFSEGDIKKLGEKYMMRLYGAVKSSRKRKHETAKTTKKLIEQLHNEAPAFQKIITRNNDLIELMLTVAKFAKEEQIVINILILGETGTGKELFAKAIHESSGRKGKLISLNCGAIPDHLFESEFFGLRKEAGVGIKTDKKGYFEEAENGTIFLDEIGELTQHHQSKILRVLQEREIQPVGGTAKKINVKIVCATNKDLEAEALNKRFREDLLGRLNCKFTIPPFRDRKNDIPLLVEYFIKKYDSNRKSNPDLPQISISDECLEKFQEYDWNKNVRELENIITAVIIDMGSKRRDITLGDVYRLGFKLQKSSNQVLQKQKSRSQKGKYTDDEIIECFLRNRNNKTLAAKELGMRVRSFRRRCKKLDPPL